MPWLSLVVIRIAVDNVLDVILKNILGSSKSRERSLAWQFFFCTIMAWVYFIAVSANNGGLGDLEFHINTIDLTILIIISLANSFACYCHWRALAISPAKTGALSVADDFIAIFLENIIIGLVIFVDPILTVGVILCFGAATIFRNIENKKIKQEEKSKSHSNLSKVNQTWADRKGVVFWVIIQTVSWGIGVFFVRYFAFQKKMPIEQFHIIWYTVSWLGALIILKLAVRAGWDVKKVARHEYWLVSILSIITIVTKFLMYWILALKPPLTSVKPIFLITGMLVPIMIEFTILKYIWKLKFLRHKERPMRNKLSKQEKLALIPAILGTIFIVIALRINGLI